MTSKREVVREAERLYDTLFRQPVPEIIVARYRDLSPLLEACLDADSVEDYWGLIDGGVDLEPIELVDRLRRRNSLLSVKLQAMLFLAETLPAHQSMLVNRRDRRLRAWTSITAGACRSALKFMVGNWQAARRRHA